VSLSVFVRFVGFGRVFDLWSKPGVKCLQEEGHGGRGP